MGESWGDRNDDSEGSFERDPAKLREKFQTARDAFYLVLANQDIKVADAGGGLSYGSYGLSQVKLSNWGGKDNLLVTIFFDNEKQNFRFSARREFYDTRLETREIPVGGQSEMGITNAVSRATREVLKLFREDARMDHVRDMFFLDEKGKPQVDNETSARSFVRSLDRGSFAHCAGGKGFKPKGSFEYDDVRREKLERESAALSRHFVVEYTFSPEGAPESPQQVMVAVDLEPDTNHNALVQTDAWMITFSVIRSPDLERETFRDGRNKEKIVDQFMKSAQDEMAVVAQDMEAFLLEVTAESAAATVLTAPGVVDETGVDLAMGIHDAIEASKPNFAAEFVKIFGAGLRDEVMVAVSESLENAKKENRKPIVRLTVAQDTTAKMLTSVELIDPLTQEQVQVALGQPDYTTVMRGVGEMVRRDLENRLQLEAGKGRVKRGVATALSELRK